MRTAKRQIAVIGGGVVGLCCALRLAAAGADVSVFEATRDRSASSWNNAGHIAVEQVAPLASLDSVRSVPRRMFARGGALDLPLAQWQTWLPFSLRLTAAARPRRFAAGKAALGGLLEEALPAWHRLGATLRQPELVRADGHLVVWETERSAQRGRAAWQRADTGATTIGSLDADDAWLLGTLSPTLDPRAAIRFEGNGQVADLGRLADALEQALAEQGVTIVRERAILGEAGGRATVSGRAFDLVVLAAGVASGASLRALGHTVPIVAERGYHIRADAGAWPPGAPPIVFEDRAMIVTRFAETVQASSFVEVAAPDAKPDPRKWERLEAHVRALGLPLRPPFSRWMGARPTLPDYLPAIGRSRRVPNLIYAFGHQHLGLTLAPHTAELVAELAAGSRPPGLAPFDIDRFARGKGKR